MSKPTETVECTFKGHYVKVGPVERVETVDRFGRKGYRRGIWIDAEFIIWSRGQDLEKAKSMAAEEVERKIRIQQHRMTP